MISITSISKKLIKNVLIIVVWLCLWQCLAASIRQPLLIVGPIDTAVMFLKVIATKKSWIMIGHSISRIGIGFFSGAVLAMILALASYQCKFVREFLAPVMILLKSIPVASFVVLILAWLSSKNLSIFIAGLVTFPVVYFDVLGSLFSLNPRILEMAKLYDVRILKRFRFLYLPAIAERLCYTARITIGMSIRAGVAAELIGLPVKSIGEAIYQAKLYFNIAELFAWTILIVLLCYGCEKLVLLLCEGIKRGLTSD